MRKRGSLLLFKHEPSLLLDQSSRLRGEKPEEAGKLHGQANRVVRDVDGPGGELTQEVQP